MLSERMVGLRKSLSITQKQLAESIGVSEIAIQNYEAQRRKPAYDVLLALADFFDVSLDSSLAGQTIRQGIEGRTIFFASLVSCLCLDYPRSPLSVYTGTVGHISSMALSSLACSSAVRSASGFRRNAVNSG